MAEISRTRLTTTSASPSPDVLDALDDQSEVVQRGAQHPDVAGELRKVTEPAEWSAQRGILVWVGRVRTG